MMRVARLFVLGGVAFALAVPAAFAQFPGGLKYVITSARAEPASVAEGAKSSLRITILVKTGFHINSAKPNDPDLIPTVVTAGPLKGIVVGTAVFPAPMTISAPSLSQQPMSVYEGTAVVKLPLSVAAKTKPGTYVIPVSISYQGCNSSACFPPKTDNLSVTLLVK